MPSIAKRGRKIRRNTVPDVRGRVICAIQCYTRCTRRMNVSEYEHLLWILPSALLVVYVGSPRFLGAMAAARTKRLLDAHFRSPEVRLCHAVDLGGPRSSSHIDHVLISRGGIHVIDSLCVWGTVKGTDMQHPWKAITRWRTREFDNPVHANKLRIEALAQALDLSLSRFQGMVVFSGHFRLSDGIPPNVIPAAKLVDRLKAPVPEVLTGVQMDKAERQLRDAIQKSPTRRRTARWKAVQLLLFLAWVAATVGVFRIQIGDLYARVQSEIAQSPAGRSSVPATGNTRATQNPDPASLNCMYSVDTGRCVCRNAAGESIAVEPQQCRDLSERGSVLKQ